MLDSVNCSISVKIEVYNTHKCGTIISKNYSLGAGIFLLFFCNIIHASSIVYKKTGEWYIEWQRVTTSGTTSDNKWYNEWCTKWQRVTRCNYNEWQRVTAVVQLMKTAQYTSKNGWLPSFQWQKQIHYYFKGWIAAIRVVK